MKTDRKRRKRRKKKLPEQTKYSVSSCGKCNKIYSNVSSRAWRSINYAMTLVLAAIIVVFQIEHPAPWTFLGIAISNLFRHPLQ